MIKEVVGGLNSLLVIGIGGGGDVVGSVPTYLDAVRDGLRAWLGSVLWERFASDPKPGPIEVNELKNSEPLGEALAWVRGDTRAVRDGRLVVAQLSIVCKTLGVRGLGVSLSRPVASIAGDLASWVSKTGVDAVVAVDVGGDSLAEGWEENLYSPLADSYALAVLHELSTKTGVRVVLGVAGPGVDGELDRGHVLKRISLIASRGGYLGAYGLTRGDYAVLKRVLAESTTEASRLLTESSTGLFGEVGVRGGSRRAFVDVSSSVTYYVDLAVAIEHLPLARAVSKCSSVWEASRKLNSMGVCTELNVEEEAYKLYKERGRLPRASEYAELYKRSRESVRRRARRA